jgi:hypothetical protein
VSSSVVYIVGESVCACGAYERERERGGDVLLMWTKSTKELLYDTSVLFYNTYTHTHKRSAQIANSGKQQREREIEIERERETSENKGVPFLVSFFSPLSFALN